MHPPIRCAWIIACNGDVLICFVQRKRVAWSDEYKSAEDEDDLTPRAEMPALDTSLSPTPSPPAYSFPANSPRKNLNESIQEIQHSMDKSMKNIIRTFNESTRRKELARKQLQKSVQRRVNYAAPPPINYNTNYFSYQSWSHNSHCSLIFLTRMILNCSIP